MNMNNNINRRQFVKAAGATAAAFTVGSRWATAAPKKPFQLNYILASSMYGEIHVEKILPEVKKTGAKYIDIWPRTHGAQREQIEAMGADAFKKLLQQHKVKVGIYTCYNPGLFKMDAQMKAVHNFGGSMVIANSGGKKNLTGSALKTELAKFAEKLKPAIELAESLGITIGVENHSGGLINSPESQLRLADAIASPHVGIALAPYHIEQDAQAIAQLIEKLGDRLVHFYAWQHGMGCMKKLPKEQELLQLPGRGSLDFRPIVGALKKIDYLGWTSVFMHPVPRGIPILPTVDEVTAEINSVRKYLDSCVG